ncbi:hypothetical protein Dimus_009318 [Dionaea muscipula]
MGSTTDTKDGHIWPRLKAVPGKLVDEVFEVAISMRNLARDDPRRVTHSLKVGLALTLVSLFYYFQPLYDNFGVSAMWAVITVVVVFEFSVGATLGKGLNRAIATLLAGVLGVGAYYLARHCGKTGEPIIIGFCVFLQAAVSTFIRFFPKIKARYDYGFVIFMLTFCFISITGFREDEILEIAHKRLSTIVIGGFASLLISIFVYPVWAGEDLHNLVALNMERLGSFLEGFGVAYFTISDNVEGNDEHSYLKGYRTVLNSKSIEETLANFARWEPAHGQFRFGHPWQQYLKVGALVRKCAYRIDALSAYLYPNIQGTAETREEIRKACKTMSLESGEVLRGLAAAVRIMNHIPSSVDAHLASSKVAVKNLKSTLESGLWEDIELQKVIPVATVASLLIDIVDCTEKIAEVVRDLSFMARFKKIEPTVSPDNSPHNCQNRSIDQIDPNTHVIVVLS